jgi:hypothetical protein
LIGQHSLSLARKLIFTQIKSEQLHRESGGMLCNDYNLFFHHLRRRQTAFALALWVYTHTRAPILPRGFLNFNPCLQLARMKASTCGENLSRPNYLSRSIISLFIFLQRHVSRRIRILFSTRDCAPMNSCRKTAFQLVCST